MSQPERWQLGGSAPEVYERYLVPAIFGPWAPIVIAHAKLEGGERVLDVACGTEIVARLAAHHVGAAGRVTGLDINPAMLAVARSLAPAHGATVEWREGDASAHVAAISLHMTRQGKTRSLEGIVDPGATLELYTRQSSLNVSAQDLAVMGATLANGGVNVLTGKRVVDAEVCRYVLAVMATAGLYETSGEWLYDIGLPGKSGVGGAILTVAARAAWVALRLPLTPLATVCAARWLPASSPRSEVVVARNRAEAVARAEELNPAVIVMHIQMSVLDGLEVTRRIRTAGLRDTPTLALTTLTMAGDRERYLAAGADSYLSKPVRLRTLMTVIVEMLAGPTAG